MAKNRYDQVKENIEAQIASGELAIGDKLCSEPEMAEIYHVSRGTIRRALEELEREAVITRRLGSGTYVIRKPKQAHIISMTDQIRQAGMQPSIRVIAASEIPASQASGRVREALATLRRNVNEIQLYCIRRVHLGNNKPLSYSTIYLVKEQFVENLLDSEDLRQSMTALYKRYYRKITWADEIIQAAFFAPEHPVYQLLELDNLPSEQRFVYDRDRISYDQDNRLLEVLQAFDRSDFFRAYRYRLVEGNRVET